MRDVMREMTDMLAIPKIGDSRNSYCPAAQLNLARAQLFDSSKCL